MQSKVPRIHVLSELLDLLSTQVQQAIRGLYDALLPFNMHNIQPIQDALKQEDI